MRGLVDLGALIKYIIKWQLGTPVLLLCMIYLPGSNLIKTILANIIGALLFYRVDKWIFEGGKNGIK